MKLYMNDESKKRFAIAQKICNHMEELSPHPAQAFIIYGSTILGTANAQSDIDIMLLVDFTERKFMTKLRERILEYQNRTLIHITINVKVVSEFLKEITEGNHYHMHIVLKGKCLLNSNIFEGFKSIVSANSLPSKKELIIKNATDTHMRVQDLFLGSLVKLCTGIRITILKYLDLKLVQSMSLDSWEEYQTVIQREAYAPTIKKFLPQYSNSVIAFFKLSDEVKPLGFDLDVLDTLPPCNFIELLECIEFINKDSQKSVQD